MKGNCIRRRLIAVALERNDLDQGKGGWEGDLKATRPRLSPFFFFSSTSPSSSRPLTSLPSPHHFGLSPSYLPSRVVLDGTQG
jgi:hypothetical protein